MTTMRRSLAFAASVFIVSNALGQQTRGVGISGGMAWGVSITHVREHWGPPDSVQLVASVIWRGRSTWNFSVGEHEAAVSRALRDSASGLSNARHRVGGGTVPTRANAGVEYDEATRIVYVLNQGFAVSNRDSTLVLLVDSVDALDAPPIITLVTVPHGTYGPKVDSTTLDAQDVGALHRRWEAVLKANPDVRAFLQRAASRKLPNDP